MLAPEGLSEGPEAGPREGGGDVGRRAAPHLLLPRRGLRHPTPGWNPVLLFSGAEERERKAAVARLPPGGSRLASLCPTKLPAPCPSLQTLYKCPLSPSICQIQLFLFFLGNFRDTSDLVNRLEFYSSYPVCSVTVHGP